MKNIIFAAVASLLCTGAAADTRSDATQLLAMWQPQSVAVERGVLKIQLPQDRITDQIYMSVLTAGLCLGHAFGTPLTGLSGVEVLNRHGRQGYVLETGLDRCATWNSRPATSSETRMDILGSTHLY